MVHDVLAMLHAALVARVEVMLVLGYSGAWALPLIRLLRPRLPIVTNIDGMEWRRDKFGAKAKRLLRWLEGMAIRHSDTIIADNAALVPLAQAAHPTLQPRLIAYGGDHTLVALKPSAERIEPGYYLSVARIEPENNCAMILDAFDRAGDQRLVFVGNWAASTYGRDLKARYGGHPRLRLLDPVYDLGVLAALRADACGYVHGHSVGGTNPSLVEALFHTSRMLAFDCSFNRETLSGRGRYFKDAPALAAALARPDALDMSPEDVEALRQRYRWRTIVDAYLEACSRR
jgi:glycosyltransferase involved in cell wall biosynthesis